ncbi:tRNA threonylcarbamoyladenosine biosynthesis protein TsaB [Sphingomonas sp. F9_3S_D5_B_2]
MLLAFDTSTAACTAALFDGSGACLDRRDELIGRGHAERLVPMIAEMLAGRTADRVLVGVGPGSFTGIRVAIAAAHGLSIGWDAELAGMSSLALIAAGTRTPGEVGIALAGGHGELFVQQFTAGTRDPRGPVANLRPADAASTITAELVVGSGARLLVEARGWGEALETLPSASEAVGIPEHLRTLPAKPIYARLPDARAKAA